MKKSEKNIILSSIAHMSDSVLESQTYDAIYDCLGSQAEVMKERGYCIEDIIERRKFEKFLSEKADLYEDCCYKRGIKLFDERKEENKVTIVLHREPIIYIDAHSNTETVLNILDIFKQDAEIYVTCNGSKIECIFIKYDKLYEFLYRLSCRFNVIIK